MRLKFISPCNEVAYLPKRSEALYIYIYVRRRFVIRFSGIIFRSIDRLIRFAFQRNPRMRAEREKNISYRFQNLWSGRRNGVTSRWTAVNPWLGNERSRAFVESNAHITYPLSSLLFHPEHDDLQTYYPLLLLFSSSFDEEKKGDTLEIFSVASNWRRLLLLLRFPSS